MIPILFEATEQNFLTNGIGRLSDAISCNVVEERNGSYELSMVYPITGIHYADIQEDRIIYAKACAGGNNQAFKIYRIARPLNGKVEIKAEHISYLLNKNVVMPFTATSASEALVNFKNHLVEASPFEFSTDLTVKALLEVDAPQNARGLLGGTNGSILQAYGGEFEFDNYKVLLHTNRGIQTNISLRYGKNITELNRTRDMTNTYVGIVPFWTNGDSRVTLPENVVWSEHAEDYAYKPIKVVDFSQEWQDAPTESQLRIRAQTYLTRNRGWLNRDNIKVSFVDLADSEEYKRIIPMQQLQLCDTITVIYTKLGVNVTAKVVKTDFNVLTEKYNSLEVGETANSLGKVLQDNYVDSILQKASTHMERAVSHATKLIQGGLGGYVVHNTDADGHPNEILIMNTPDKDTATQVLRINLNGIGFGKSYDGPFNTAWTLEGHFIADFIDTGNLNASLLTVGTIADKAGNMTWSLESGNITAKRLTIDSPYFKLSDDGRTTLSSGMIGGATIENNSIHASNNNWIIDSTGDATFKSVTLTGVKAGSQFGSINYNGSTTSGLFGGASTFTSSTANPLGGTAVTQVQSLAAGEITADRIRATNVLADYATVTALNAVSATVNEINANYATVSQLNAVNGKFSHLNADNLETGSINGNRIEIYNARLKGDFTSISGDFVWNNHNIGTASINGHTVLVYDD